MFPSGTPVVSEEMVDEIHLDIATVEGTNRRICFAIIGHNE